MKKFIGAASLYAIPMLALAGNAADVSYFENLAGDFGNIIDILLPIVIALGLLFFFWGLATFILAAGDEEKREKGKKIMIWGIVALFAMVTVWGLVNFLNNILGIQQSQIIDTPFVPLD